MPPAAQLVLLGRIFSRGSPGTAYGLLLTATFYTFLILFSLAGTLSAMQFKAVRARCP